MLPKPWQAPGEEGQSAKSAAQKGQKCQPAQTHHLTPHVPASHSPWAQGGQCTPLVLEGHAGPSVARKERGEAGTPSKDPQETLESQVLVGGLLSPHSGGLLSAAPKHKILHPHPHNTLNKVICITRYSGLA